MTQKMERTATVNTAFLLFTTLCVLAAPVVGIAQTATPQASISVAGQWVLALKVTRGNDIDKTRMGQGGTLYCVQNKQDVICSNQGHSNLLNGTFDGTKIVLDGRWMANGVSTVMDCWAYTPTPNASTPNCTSEKGRYLVQMNLTGALDGAELSGQWIAYLLLGGGRYRIEGTWKAIRVASRQP